MVIRGATWLSRPRWRLAPSSRRGRAFTLVEILVVIALMAILTVAIGAGARQLPSARLKHSATTILAAIKTAFTRATATSKNLRLVFDFDNPSIQLEEADIPMLVQSKDIAKTGGADPVTEAERAAVAEEARISKGVVVAKPRFHAIPFRATQGSSAPEAVKLDRGVTFREVQTAHDEDPLKKGRAYLYFWPGGLTERGNIQLKVGTSTDESGTLTLVVSPLTGRVHVKTGAEAFAPPRDEREKSEREDNGP